MTAPILRLRYLVILSLALLSPSIVAAKAPNHGERPALGRTTGYWAQVERVVDGDTFWADGVKYRVSGLDAPETRSDPRHGYKCQAEMLLGRQSTDMARALLANRKVWIKPTGHHDRYKRPLVTVRVAKGQWFSEIMIRKSVAVKWQGRKHHWCKAE